MLLINKYFKRQIFWDEIYWGENESFDEKFKGFLYENNALKKAISYGLTS